MENFILWHCVSRRMLPSCFCNEFPISADSWVMSEKALIKSVFLLIINKISYTKWWWTPAWKYCVTWGFFYKMGHLMQVSQLTTWTGNPDCLFIHLTGLPWIIVNSEINRCSSHLLNLKSTETTGLEDLFRHLLSLIFVYDC